MTAMLIVCTALAATPDEEVRLGLASAGLVTGAYLAVAMLSEHDEGNRAVGAIAGSVTGAALGIGVAALIGDLIGAFDAGEDGMKAVMYTLAVVLPLAFGFAGGASGYYATRYPSDRVAAHLIMAPAMGLSITPLLLALID